MTQLASGRVLGRFRVIGPLGRGGMAAVFRAEETTLGREVALKVLPAALMEQDGFLERFEREAQLIAQLEHPNIVPLYASGIDEGIPWMALRLVTDGTLQERLEAGNLDVEAGLRVFAQVARALDHAHARGILHRDLKPQNVLLGGDGTAYLADFGIARMLSGNSALTGTGMMLGTPSYMAPEQARGGELGPACDIYALAVMLYRWLCGTVPFDADTPMAVMMKHIEAPVPPEPMDSLSESVKSVVLTGLAKDPKQRWDSASAMMSALNHALHTDATRVVAAPQGSAVDEPPAAPGLSATKPKRTFRWMLVALPVLLGSVAVAIQLWPSAADDVPAFPTAVEQSDPPPAIPATRTNDDQTADQNEAVAAGIDDEQTARVSEHSTTTEATPNEQTALVAAAAEPLTEPAPSNPVTAPVARPADDRVPEPAELPVQPPIASADESPALVEEPASPLEAGTVFRDCPQCPALVVIPGGRFVMGSPADEPQRNRAEGPQREIDMPSFALATYETRFAEWDLCLAEGGCKHRPDDKGWGGSEQPVIHVSWNDAQDYVVWLSARTGQRYRLPSEAEWEYAARAGTTGRHYLGDCMTSDLANFNARRPAQGCERGEFRERPLPVGSFPPNPFGLHDMHGNVWEWVQDCANGSYQGAPISGSAWMRGNCNRGTVRGGAWHDWGFWLRAAARYSFPRDSRHPVGGFRVARELP
jgi:formylglycine-generating enzyme required for sulfatase activity/predicted Ser/Thr protein kinase